MHDYFTYSTHHFFVIGHVTSLKFTYFTAAKIIIFDSVLTSVGYRPIACLTSMLTSRMRRHLKLDQCWSSVADAGQH